MPLSTETSIEQNNLGKENVLSTFNLHICKECVTDFKNSELSVWLLILIRKMSSLLKMCVWFFDSGPTMALLLLKAARGGEMDSPFVLIGFSPAGFFANLKKKCQGSSSGAQGARYYHEEEVKCAKVLK